MRQLDPDLTRQQLHVAVHSSATTEFTVCPNEITHAKGKGQGQRKEKRKNSARNPTKGQTRRRRSAEIQKKKTGARSLEARSKPSDLSRFDWPAPASAPSTLDSGCACHPRFGSKNSLGPRPTRQSPTKTDSAALRNAPTRFIPHSSTIESSLCELACCRL